MRKYKIYINGSPVFITTPEEAALLPYKPGKNSFIIRYTGKKKLFSNYLDLMMKCPAEALVFYHEDIEQLWTDFCEKFKLVDAAGGLVTCNNQMLVCYRRGSWDLPKGKIEPGESPPEAAVREVIEETGLGAVTLDNFLGHTYHTYPLPQKMALKKTWWYHMETTDTTVVPQTEEDIEKIEWVDPKNWLHANPVVYPNIRDVILAYLEQNFHPLP
jgi:8-oxo-dGTP pyrophosphatase MutT (NUDIX family)